MPNTYDHLSTEELTAQIAKREAIRDRMKMNSSTGNETTLTRYMAAILKGMKAELVRRQS